MYEGSLTLGPRSIIRRTQALLSKYLPVKVEQVLRCTGTTSFQNPFKLVVLAP